MVCVCVFVCEIQRPVLQFTVQLSTCRTFAASDTDQQQNEIKTTAERKGKAPLFVELELQLPTCPPAQLNRLSAPPPAIERPALRQLTDARFAQLSNGHCDHWASIEYRVFEQYSVFQYFEPFCFGQS